MQTIGSFWWVWLAGLLVCWGYVLFNQLRQMQVRRSGDLDKSLAQSTGASMNVLVGARYLGFVFLVLLVFAIAVKLMVGVAP